MICTAGLGIFLNIDRALLEFFNTTLANSLFDSIMPVITSIDFWRWPIVLALLGIAVFGGRYGLVSVVLGLVLLTVTDQVSSSILKDFFGRVRPCHDEHLAIRVLTTCGNSKAFPSSHAVNTMAAALFFGYRYRKILIELVGLSLLVSYSRVYIGIHYPGDLLAGWIFGAVCVLALLAAYRPLKRRWPQIESSRRWGWMSRVFRRRSKAG